MHLKRIIAIAVCLICFGCALSAQSDIWYYGKPIKYISFKGLSAINSADIAPYTDPYLDKTFDDEVYLDILNTVYSLEYFEDISAEVKPADADGLTLNLEFTVIEYPVVKDIKFNGNVKLRNSVLKDALNIEKGDVFIERKVSVNERKIRDLYLEKGYTEVRVSSSIEETEQGIEISFEISEGSASIISLIQFEGNVVFASKTLKKQCSLKESSLFQKGAFKESALELDRQNILLYYLNRGYVDVQITDIRRDSTYNKEKDQNELTLTFVIEEGDQYHFAGITFEGNNIFETERLTSLITMKEGDVFNKTKFDECIEAVFNLYLENGYISNGFNYSYNTDTENNEISCVVSIVERDRGHIESITIEGNKKTKEYVIRRELGLETGDIYSKTKIESGLRNLYNTQYFSAIEPDFVQGSEMNLIDMTLKVEEAQTAEIGFGITFSGIENANTIPMSALIDISDSNFKGYGKTVSTKLTVSSAEQSISLGYDDSWFLDKPLNISLSVYASKAKKNCLQNMYLPSGINVEQFYMDYDELKFGASAAVGKRWNPNFAIVTLTGGVSTGFIMNQYDSTLYTPVDSSISMNLDKWGTENSIWTSFSLDDRDVYYDPTKGWFASQKLSLVGLIPEIETEYYFKSETKAEYYHSLINHQFANDFKLNLVFAGYAGLTFMSETTDTTISNHNLLYIDGMFNGRGWSNLFNERGKAMLTATSEIRWPVAPGIFAVDFYFDAAVVKPTVKDVFTNLKIEDIYFSYGPGIRFSIPQFPLRLLLANTFQIVDGKVAYTNKWSFTLSFNLPNR